MIGTLPSLSPRPTATNIRALGIDLVDNLTMIPSEQYVGYLGVGQIIGERDMWPWIFPIHPQDVRFECVDDVSLYFP